MSDRPSFYITTTLPYVNADPHIGFAMEIVRADIIARMKRAEGFDVFFNTGTDEHGVKVHRKAVESGIKPQTYVDTCAEKFRSLKEPLGLLPDLNFIRTTDPHHVHAAQEFWKICARNGYIYKKNYRIKYCVGCELEKTDSELVDGRCPLHAGQEIEQIDEENYFFKFSSFSDELMHLYDDRRDFVVPATRHNEIRSFVMRGLEDFSISRLKEKMPWGIAVPGDDSHVMYVWFDALVNYISAIGWPSDIDKFNRFWISSGGVVQYCGKDNLRQQAAMWQAMLMSVNLPPSRQIIIDGFITSGGQKMSKSVGNVIDPFTIVNEYGTDALRYYIARELHPFEDSDFTMEKFKDAYNANLANGLGNLVSRVVKMATANGVLFTKTAVLADTEARVKSAFEKYDLKSACDAIWSRIQSTDKRIQEEQPFKIVKDDPEKGKLIIGQLLSEIYHIALLISPIMPATSEKILACVTNGAMPSAPLFLRRE
jgi:methionyl-tRNA synthetase